MMHIYKASFPIVECLISFSCFSMFSTFSTVNIHGIFNMEGEKNFRSVYVLVTCPFSFQAEQIF